MSASPAPSFTLHEPTPSHPRTMPFGRGGAGNRTTTTSSTSRSARHPLPPTSLPCDTHSLHSTNTKTHGMPHYSTGRGGAGNMHNADEERRIFSFDEELAKQGKVGAVPVYHVGRGGVGNEVVEGAGWARRRGSGGSKGSGGSERSGSGSGSEGLRGSLEWVRGLGRKA